MQRSRQQLVVGIAQACVALAMLSPAAAASASAPEVNLHRIDGVVLRGTYQGIVESGFRLVGSDGENTVPFDTVSRLDFRDASAASPPLDLTVLFIARGQWFTGQITGPAESGLRVRTERAGEFEVPFSHLAAIRFAQTSDNAQAREAFERALQERVSGKDVLISTGDTVRTARGALLTLEAAQGRFVFGGQERTFQVSGMYGVVLGQAGAGNPPATAVVRFIDGSSIFGIPQPGGPDALKLDTSFGHTVELPIEQIASLSVQSSSVVYLSDLQPTRSDTTSLLHDPGAGQVRPWPVRLDRSVTNQAIRLDGVEFDRGLGVHSRTELDYTIDGAYQTFCATIGIDDAVRPGGDVVFRVLGDGRELFNSGPVTGTTPGRQIAVDVAGVRQLSLVVDFGAVLDLSDQADWAAARLIKAETDSAASLEP